MLPTSDLHCSYLNSPLPISRVSVYGLAVLPWHRGRRTQDMEFRLTDFHNRSFCAPLGGRYTQAGPRSRARCRKYNPPRSITTTDVVQENLHHGNLASSRCYRAYSGRLDEPECGMMFSLKYNPWGNTLLANTVRCTMKYVLVSRLRISSGWIRRGKIKYLMVVLES
jgi:hypothetical protein